MFNVHAVWSIATPIALVEACVPDRAHTPWLGRVGLAVTAIIFLFGATSTTAIGYRQDHYLASLRQFVAAAVVVILLIAAAFSVRKKSTYGRSEKAPSAWTVGAVALLFGSAALFVPQSWGWWAVAELAGLDLVMILVILAWSRRNDWALRHQLALGAGAALAYGWHAFLQHPAVGKLDSSVRIGNAIFLAWAIGLIAFAASRVAKAEQQSAT
jgi:hypothetical protein